VENEFLMRAAFIEQTGPVDSIKIGELPRPQAGPGQVETDDIPARLREFSPEGIDVWLETQPEPDLEVSIPRGQYLRGSGLTGWQSCDHY
jgi:hypothetical protein